MAMEMLARKLPHVGATPRWMLLITVRKLKSRNAPRITSTNCVTRSSSASIRLTALDSWIPIVLTTISTATTATAAPMCQPGCCSTMRTGR